MQTTSAFPDLEAGGLGTSATAGDRTPLTYRVAIVATVVAFVLNGFAVLLTSPREDGAFSAIASIVFGTMVVGLVYRPGPRRAVVGFVILLALGLYYSAASPDGVALGIMLPAIGSLMLVPSVRGRHLLPLLVVGGLAAFLGFLLAWTVGGLRVHAGETFVPTSLSSFAILSAVGGISLWWVAYLWRHSIAHARRAGALAAASDARYRDLFEQSAEAIVVSDADGRLIDVNGAACILLDETRDALLGRDILALLVPDQVDATRAYLSTIQAAAPTVADATLLAHDGRRIDIESSVRRLEDGGTVFMVRDITARLEAEQVRRELAAAVDQTADLVIVFDNLQVIRYVNPAFERLTGWTAAEAVGQHANDVIPSTVHPRSWFYAINAALARGESWSGRMFVTDRSGGLLDQDVSLSPIRDSFGRVIGGVHVGRDVSRERALEEQLRHSAKMEAVGLLAGGVAHDVNNVLTVIRGYTDLVLGELPAELVDARNDLAQVNIAADRASAITRQLLTFARRSVIAPRVLDPGDVVEDIAAMLRRLIGEDVRLEVRRGADAGRVLADVSQLEQVVVNLAVNARDAMPGGGTLIIETAGVDLDAAYVAAHPEVEPGPFVRLSVTDTGVGMDEDVVHRVFTPFFTTKAPGKGTGMGLAVVYGVVRASGGTVDVLSTPGAGTSMHINLPRVTAELEHAAAADEGQPVPGGSETVLLVEDEPAVRTFASRSLRRLGYTVVEAGSGEEALERAAALDGPIDILVSDTVMPGMPGTELARRMVDLRPGLRVVLASGYTEHALLLDESTAEQFAFLPKPYSQRDLARAVRSLLDPAA